MLLSNKWRLVSSCVSTQLPQLIRVVTINTYQQPTSRDRTAGRSRHELARLMLSQHALTRTLKLHPRVTTLQSNDVQRGVVRAQVARTLAKQAKHGETMFAVAVRAGTMAQVRANARSRTREILQAQLCPVLSLSISLSLSLSPSGCCLVLQWRALRATSRCCVTQRKLTHTSARRAPNIGNTTPLCGSPRFVDSTRGVPLVDHAATH